jgi:FkbM family methyltransferase
MIEQRQGWWWPKNDSLEKRLLKYADLPQQIKKYVNSFDTAVQAGGNTGFYTAQYAAMFDTVYTFEPDYLNFQCMSRNLTEQNIIKLQACVGDTHGLVGLNIVDRNRGENSVNGTGIYPMLTIDDLSLNSCNLIHLDIEGYELYAIKGAVNTIVKYKPTVVLEVWDHSDTQIQLEQLLAELDYKMVDILGGSDRVYIASTT